MPQPPSSSRPGPTPPQPPRRAALRAAALAALLVAGVAPRARAGSLEGVQFDDRITLAGRELVLNGIGLRAAGWFKAYVAAMYLPQVARSEHEVLAQPGPKRVRLVLLVDAPAVELAKGFDKGVRRNSSAAELAALDGRFKRMFVQMESAGKLAKGDVVDLDYDPAKGTTLLLNSRARGEPIAGADFHLAVLRSFVGGHPYHRRLKQGMLGLPVT